jgi:hypothetical protein
LPSEDLTSRIALPVLFVAESSFTLVQEQTTILYAFCRGVASVVLLASFLERQ